jgi:hypothetical protein
MELLGKWKGKTKITVVVPPGQTEFVAVKRSGAGKSSFGVSKQVKIKKV